MIFVTIREHFSAAHRMYREEWSAEKNFDEFGKCANPNWHGHNYELFVTLKGIPHNETGRLFDLEKFRVLLQKHVLRKIDHKNLNMDVDFMHRKMATTEILCIAIFNELRSPIESHEGVFIHSVRLCETDNNSAEYFGK